MEEAKVGRTRKAKPIFDPSPDVPSKKKSEEKPAEQAVDRAAPREATSRKGSSEESNEKEDLPGQDDNETSAGDIVEGNEQVQEQEEEELKLWRDPAAGALSKLRTGTCSSQKRIRFENLGSGDDNKENGQLRRTSTRGRPAEQSSESEPLMGSQAAQDDFGPEPTRTRVQVAAQRSEEPGSSGQGPSEATQASHDSDVPEPPRRIFTRRRTAKQASDEPEASGQEASMANQPAEVDVGSEPPRTRAKATEQRSERSETSGTQPSLADQPRQDTVRREPPRTRAAAARNKPEPPLIPQEELLKLSAYPIGSYKFLAEFTLVERRLFDINRKDACYWEDGYNYEEKIGKLDRVHVFKTTEGLDFKCPKGLDFTTADEYLFLKHELGYNNSETQDRINGSIQDLLDKFAEERNLEETVEDNQKPILNSLTHLFVDDRLYDLFELPGYVRDHSMVGKLRTALESRYYPDGTKRPEKEVRMLNEMPEYERFFFMSMKGCFTNVHIDFSGCSVYNFVQKGQKVFFFVPFTPKNFEVFRKHQLSGDPSWLAEHFADQWERVVVDEGQIIFIPSGYLHFVYTPVDTIMIGANFISEEYLARQMEITRFEEIESRNREGEDKNNKTHMFEKFWDVMWAYTEYYLLPELRAPHDNATTERLLGLASDFSRKLRPNKKDGEWYKLKDKERVAQKLKVVMRKLNFAQKRAADDEPKPSGAAPKRARVQEEEKEDLESEGPYGNGPVWIRRDDNKVVPEDQDF